MQASAPELRFMLDHMVIKLGKYLRILGYDAVWDKQVRTHALIARANAEGRVFLTRNTGLAERYGVPDRACYLRDTDPVKQLQAVIAEFKLDSQTGLFSRCIRCNVPLTPVSDTADIRQRVHPNVFLRHQRFFTCPNCRTVFWHGSHVLNTRRKLFGECR